MPITTPFNLLSGGADISESGSPAVGGPSFSTDKALVRWNGTAGNLVQNGVVTEADYTGNLTGATDQATTTATGLAFTNQPANDGVEVLSSNAGDTTQTVTIIGTTNGTDTVVVETVTLAGTTPVATVKTDWGVILAVKKSATTLGTVTVREASGDATITAGLTAAVLSVGVTTVTNTAAFNQLLSMVANGATTKQLGFQGTNTAGTVIYDSQALTGTTAALSNSSFYTLTEIYRGDLEAARTATVTTNGSWMLTGGGGATLSFDTLGTAVSPGTDTGGGLGSSGKRWSQLYTGTNGIFFGPAANPARIFTSADAANANLVFSPDGTGKIVIGNGSNDVSLVGANNLTTGIAIEAAANNRLQLLGAGNAIFWDGSSFFSANTNKNLGTASASFRWGTLFIQNIKIGDGTNGPSIGTSGASPNESLVLTPGSTSGSVLIPTTNILKFGATAAATIGVSADTTAGIVTFVAPSSGSYSFDKLFTTYNGMATAGNGIVSVQGAGRSTAQIAAVASVAAYTVGAADASFEVSANVNVTTATAHSFSVTATYTDETNASRTITMPFIQVGGVTLVGTITNVTGSGPYEGVPVHIRAKASTAITIATAGTFTTVTYNVEGNIRKVA